MRPRWANDTWCRWIELGTEIKNGALFVHQDDQNDNYILCIPDLVALKQKSMLLRSTHIATIEGLVAVGDEWPKPGK